MLDKIRFDKFIYTSEGLPEGVVFFGQGANGSFHQMTRNSEPSPENEMLPAAVDDSIKAAKEELEEGASIGFSSPTFDMLGNEVYARCTSTLNINGGLSFAENIFYFDDEHRLVQIQCGSNLVEPKGALHARRTLAERNKNMIEAVLRLSKSGS